MKERGTRKYKSYRLRRKTNGKGRKLGCCTTTAPCIRLVVKIYKFLETCEGTITDHNSCFTFFSDYNCSTLVLFIVYVPISLILLSPVKCSDRGKSDESS